jgi:DNA-binding PadR family transcriptional regulator
MFGGFGGEMGHRMRGMNRMRGGLRYFVIYLLKTKPMNGMELMNAMESNSMGFWRPSPGSIYPLLDHLSKENLVSKRPDGKYELTEEGKEAARFGGFFGMHSPSDAEEMISEMNSYLSYMEDLKLSDPEKIKALSGKLGELSRRISDLTKE